MPRIRNPNRDKAFKLYKKHFSKISCKEIALILGEKERNISYWKSKDKWKEKYNPKGGAPRGNKNAVGNKGGGAPMKNQNSRKDGWYSKYYPTECKNIIKEAEESGASPIEILWAQIVTQWSIIIRAQKIMFVKDKADKTKELKKEKESSGKNGDSWEKEYEIQQAWDKHANFMNSQSRAMTTLTNMLKRYDEMLHANWDTVSEEQKLRVERLKTQIDNPDLKHRKEVSNKKIQLDRERFEHQKKMDDLKGW